MQIQGATVAFIGTGVMGASMARHLMHAGAQVTVYNRTKAKAEQLIAEGAQWAGTIPEAVRGKSVIFTMVGYPADVEAVYLSKEGILEHAAPGTILVDHTTSDPALAVRIAQAAEQKSMQALDAPVSGGDIGAKNATLTIMVGGPKLAFDEVLPFFEAMGKKIVLQGGPGSGQHTKMANQIAIAGSLTGAVEAICYAEVAGLEPLRVLESIGGGSAQSWQLVNMVPRMLNGDFEPGFYAKHFLKDLRIALDNAKKMNLRLPLLELAEQFFSKASDKGFGEKGTQILYYLYKNGII